MGLAYSNTNSSTGTATATLPAAPQVTWNVTSIEVCQSGPAISPNGRLKVFDGAVGGTVIYQCPLTGPSQAGVPTGGSVGWTQKINIPLNSQGQPGLQGTPGNAMNIQVTGTGPNQVDINVRATDGLS